MSPPADLLSLLRRRSAHALGERYRVTAYDPQETDGLWVGEDAGLAILGARGAPAAGGLLIRPREGAARLSTIAALLSSNLGGSLLPRPLTRASLQALPLPARDALFEAQLAALWHAGTCDGAPGAPSPRWRTIQRSFDRIFAELYHLSLDELMTFVL